VARLAPATVASANDERGTAGAWPRRGGCAGNRVSCAAYYRRPHPLDGTGRRGRMKWARIVSDSAYHGGRMLNVGARAPEFELADSEMEVVSLSAFRGKPVVLYFYPKDDTPGCTIEAIEFSELAEQFEALGAVVLGVSMDDCLSHGS